MHDKKERRIINQIFRGKCLNDVQINGWVAYLKKVKSRGLVFSMMQKVTEL